MMIASVVLNSVAALASFLPPDQTDLDLRVDTASAPGIEVNSGSLDLLQRAGTPSGPSNLQGDANAGPPAFTPQELDDLLGPIALYPDPLIAQVLAASAYPLEIVQAARWVRNHDDLKGLDDQPWEPSVLAVARYPSVLKMLDDDLNWTIRLGQAFVNQQDDVMDSVQRLRSKAQTVGSLRDSAEQRVVVENTIVRIVPAQPDVIYVPTYNPQIVYVDPTPGYVVSSYVSFSTGFALGWWLDLDCDWHHRHVYYHHWSHRDWDRWGHDHHDWDHHDHDRWDRDRHDWDRRHVSQGRREGDSWRRDSRHGPLPDHRTDRDGPLPNHRVSPGFATDRTPGAVGRPGGNDRGPRQNTGEIRDGRGDNRDNNRDGASRGPRGRAPEAPRSGQGRPTTGDPTPGNSAPGNSVGAPRSDRPSFTPTTPSQPRSSNGRGAPAPSFEPRTPSSGRGQQAAPPGQVLPDTSRASNGRGRASVPAPSRGDSGRTAPTPDRNFVPSTPRSEPSRSESPSVTRPAQRPAFTPSTPSRPSQNARGSQTPSAATPSPRITPSAPAPRPSQSARGSQPAPAPRAEAPRVDAPRAAPSQRPPAAAPAPQQNSRPAVQPGRNEQNRESRSQRGGGRGRG
jgi:hypothetical protein